MRNSRLPVCETSRARQGAGVIDIDATSAARSLLESLHDFSAVHWDHEPSTGETAPLRCCRHLAGSAFVRLVVPARCRQHSRVLGKSPIPPGRADAVSNERQRPGNSREVYFSHGSVHCGYGRQGRHPIPCAGAHPTAHCALSRSRVGLEQAMTSDIEPNFPCTLARSAAVRLLRRVLSTLRLTSESYEIEIA